jgi:hypothetical protein
MAKTKGAVSVKIDMAEVEKLAAMGCTQGEMAEWFGCSIATIERRLADPANHVIYRRGCARMLVSIRRQQIAIMMAGSAAMAIFLGKQYLGQRDKIDHAVSKEPDEMTLEDFLRTSQRLLDSEEDKKK